MAETVYLLDGTMEVVLTEKDVFIDRLVREKLGDDAARFISDYIEEIAEDAEDAKYTEEARQEAERTADGYLALCQGALAALSELKDLTHEARLDRAKIQKIVDGAYRELYHNL